jgi:hypothetical protein
MLYAEDNEQEFYYLQSTGYPLFWWNPIIKNENGSTKVLSCPSMKNNGIWADYSTSFIGSNPDRTRGFSRVTVDIEGIDTNVDICYGINMSIGKGNNMITNFRYPSEKGLMGELPSFYWWNTYNPSHGLVWSQWFTDRHR